MAKGIENVSKGEAGDYESIAVSTVVKTFTSSKILRDSSIGRIKASKAVFRVEGDAIRFTIDGTTPAAATGMLAAVDDIVTIEGEEDVASFKAIRVTTNATIKPIYFR
jgi:hypothetical protein